MSELTDSIDRNAPSIYRVVQGGTKRFHVYAIKMTKYRLRSSKKIHTATTNAAAHRFLGDLINPKVKNASTKRKTITKS
jgi:hypothetical protein